ncbi:hypothetical protein GCM10009584_00830 [Ornithinimicrobium humiphilum]|uniref:Glyoxalase-like domain-containing protein n=1 Tax=Ornithinimicrobium humiphilum TaxID=125288 RepID=A0A543KRE9_9MICO|nr:VOC family protein [Ornithinimicrobium humiphilum]TQM97649.1 hypothetical protein FB476_2572 [Ornithinimicrobium humiphilum]
MTRAPRPRIEATSVSISTDRPRELAAFYAAEAWAVELGARRSAVQPQEGVRVMLDPHGHPFCFFTA